MYFSFVVLSKACFVQQQQPRLRGQLVTEEPPSVVLDDAEDIPYLFKGGFSGKTFTCKEGSKDAAHSISYEVRESDRVWIEKKFAFVVTDRWTWLWEAKISTICHIFWLSARWLSRGCSEINFATAKVARQSLWFSKTGTQNSHVTCLWYDGKINRDAWTSSALLCRRWPPTVDMHSSSPVAMNGL